MDGDTSTGPAEEDGASVAGTSGADSPASGAAELTSAGASVGAGEDTTGPATGASVAGPSGSTLETASILGVTAGASVEGGTSGAAEEDDPASGVGASVLGDSADSDSVVTTGASVAGEEDEDSTGPATGPSVVGTSSPASGVTGASVEGGTSEGAEVEEADPASGTDAGASVDASIGPAEEVPLSDPPSSVGSAGSGVVDSEPDEVDPLSPVVGTDGAFVGGLISMVGTPDPVGGCVWLSTGISVVITSGSSVEISPPLGPALLLLDSDTWDPEEIADDSVVAAGATASFVSETGGITSGDSVSLTRAGGASVASVPVVPEVSPDGAADDDGSTGCDSVVAGVSVAAGRRASFDSEITSGNSVDDDGKTVVVGGSVAGSSVDDDGDAEEELSLLVSGVTIASVSSVVTEGSGVVATSDGDSVSVVSESTDSLSSPDPSPPVDMSVTCSSGFCVGSTGATGVADVVAGSSSWSSHSKTGQHLLGMKTGLQLGM